jgi:hypothetical protein
MTTHAEIVRAIKMHHILEAFRDIKEQGVPKGRNSTKWSFDHRGHLYPPKFLVAGAYNLATGKTLSPKEHHGGEQDSNEVLRTL